jgi:hypothetical protein
MRRGPVEVLFLTFPSDVPLADLAGVIRKPVEAGSIRLIDCVLMQRGEDGSVALSDLEEEVGLPSELSGLDIDPHDLLSDVDIAVFVDSLEDGQLGVALVFEQLWAKEAVDTLESLGAEIGLYARIAPDDVEAAFAAEDRQ